MNSSAKNTIRKVLLLVLGASTLQSTIAQSAQDTAAQIEKIFARYLPQEPGAQLTVSRYGQVVFSKTWGMADMEHNIPMTMENVTEAGSVSKQFTAAAILLLEQQGKLSVNDDIRKYIPEMKDYGNIIRIKHLMHHTSGIKDWGSIAELAGWARTTKTYRNDDALEIIARQKTLNNIPGEMFVYSNSNYNLQAIIVQRISGMSLADFSKQYIFIPAGMTHTQWRDNFKRIVPNRAIAYEKTAEGYFTDMPNEYVYGNGGLLTTTEDLCRWVQFYSSGKFGLLQQQIAVDTFNSGNINVYAAGLRILKAKGYDVYRHNGATASYRASLEYFPEVGIAIAGLSNTSRFDTSYDAFSRIEDIFLPKKVPAAKPADIKTDETQLKTFTGNFRSAVSGEGLDIVLKNGKLIANGSNLSPISETAFRMGQDVLSLKAGEVKLINPDRDTMRFLPVTAANITPQLLKEYAGEYHSDETDSELKLVIENNALRLYLHPYKSYALVPVYKDAFTVSGLGGTLFFERAGRSLKMKMSISRARNVEFTRLKN